jgi:hypothetical protein
METTSAGSERGQCGRHSANSSSGARNRREEGMLAGLVSVHFFAASACSSRLRNFELCRFAFGIQSTAVF